MVTTHLYCSLLRLRGVCCETLNHYKSHGNDPFNGVYPRQQTILFNTSKKG